MTDRPSDEAAADRFASLEGPPPKHPHERMRMHVDHFESRAEALFEHSDLMRKCTNPERHVYVWGFNEDCGKYCIWLVQFKTKEQIEKERKAAEEDAKAPSMTAEQVQAQWAKDLRANPTQPMFTMPESLRVSAGQGEPVFSEAAIQLARDLIEKARAERQAKPANQIHPLTAQTPEAEPEWKRILREVGFNFNGN